MIKKIIRNSKLKIRNCQSGMTFIELIVVIGIFATLTTVVLLKFGDFSSAISIRNLANDIASRAVGAQTSAVSGRQISVAFFKAPSYGLYFDISSAANQKKFKYFADLDNSGSFNTASICPSLVDECLDEVNISSTDFISNLCTNNLSGGGVCGNDLTIYFVRPYLDAHFQMSAQSGPVSDAEIELQSAKGTHRTIVVRSTGQVEIK
jgi:prepilin-type N-terminal cleavage/methylation domain-containing protein